MAYVIDPNAVEVRLAVTVYVNPADETLLDVIRESCGTHSIRDIVRGEIESNLESVPTSLTLTPNEALCAAGDLHARLGRPDDTPAEGLTISRKGDDWQ